MNQGLASSAAAAAGRLRMQRPLTTVIPETVPSSNLTPTTMTRACPPSTSKAPMHRPGAHLCLPAVPARDLTRQMPQCALAPLRVDRLRQDCTPLLTSSSNNPRRWTRVDCQDRPALTAPGPPAPSTRPEPTSVPTRALLPAGAVSLTPCRTLLATPKATSTLVLEANI